MSEISKILKSYILSVIITVMITLVFCGIFTAKGNTETMLFGNTSLLPKQALRCIISLY